MKKNLHRILSAVLATVSLYSLFLVPGAAATAPGKTETLPVSTFSDITDETLGQAVESLRMMGVIDGRPDGSFDPEGTLTRAEFCKLTITIMGLGENAAAQSTRTIFTDVTANHWASGYINLASSQIVGVTTENSTGTKLIMGVGDGTFCPDRSITYGEAVTILLRILGYTSESNVSWPNGAISTAAAIGLSDGLPNLTADHSLTRAQAALLFYHMLLTTPKGNSSLYIASRGKVEDNVLLLDCNATASNGSEGAVLFAGKSAVLPVYSAPASFLQGKMGRAVFDSSGLFLTFLPKEGNTNITMSSKAASESGLTLSDGSFLALSATTPVWRDGTQTVYGTIWKSLDRSNLTFMVYYTAAGTVDYLYVNTTPSTSGALVNYSASSGNPFLSLLNGDTNYTIYKNGCYATISDIKPYDVATYDSVTHSLYISDLRLSGYYENAKPNTSTPTSITLMGAEFEVLESAWDSLRNFHLGESITLLFTSDGKVAGAVSTTLCRANAVGIATLSGNTVTVTLLDSVLPQLKGNAIGTNVGFLDGQLVSVTYGSSAGDLSLSRLTSHSIPGSLNVTEKTIGTKQLADQVHIYDRVGKSPIVEISLQDIPFLKVDKSDITYARTNYAGKVDLLILEDVTGDAYQYGMVNTTSDLVSDDNSNQTKPDTSTGNNTSITYTTTFLNGDTRYSISTGTPYYSGGQFVGWVTGTSADGQHTTLIRHMELKSTVGFIRQLIDLQSNSITVNNMTLPISSNLQCYSQKNGRWMTLDELMVNHNSFVAYYDRSPNEGGKVRVLVGT